MTIKLNLPPDIVQPLFAQANARGLSLDSFLQRIVARQAATFGSTNPISGPGREIDDPDAAIDTLFDAVAIPPGVGQGAMLRENWYR